MTFREFFNKTEPGPNDCLLWTGHKTGRKGLYGHFKENGRWTYTHRWIYEKTIGPILPDLTIDHLCRNPSCVNPTHLEQVTLVENVMRGDGFGPKNAAKTHCINGHPFEGENLVVFNGKRKCRTCGRESMKRQYDANPEKFRERSRVNRLQRKEVMPDARSTA